MSEFLEEVKEDLRQELLLKLWQRYKAYVYGGLGLFFVVTGGFLYWQSASEARDQRHAEAFAQAVALGQAGQTDAALQALEALGEESGGAYPMLARFRVAATLITRSLQSAQSNTKDLERAVDALKKIEASSQDVAYTGLARLLRLYLTFDASSADAIKAELSALQKANNPWQALAHEMMVWLELREKNPAAAHALAVQLAKELDAPMALRQRADQIAVMTQGSTLATHAAVAP